MKNNESKGYSTPGEFIAQRQQEAARYRVELTPGQKELQGRITALRIMGFLMSLFFLPVALMSLVYVVFHDPLDAILPGVFALALLFIAILLFRRAKRLIKLRNSGRIIG